MSDAILVTGASRGIGAAIAEALARAGYVVGCLSRSGDLPQRSGLTADVAARLVPLAADVTDGPALCACAARLAERAPLVGLVNNAGLHREYRATELTVADLDAMMAVNVTSVLLGSQAVYPHLVATGGGLIVNIGSFFDRLGVKRNLAYCASKAALAAITRVLAVEWAAQGIRAMTVAPGYIVTDLNREAMEEGALSAYLAKRIPRGTAGDADEVARVVAGLFAMESGFLTGETLYLDGGQGVAH